MTAVEQQQEQAEQVQVAQNVAQEAQPAADASPELCAKIRKQVEFYLNDANLAKDAFLLQELKKNEEQWIAVDVLASFKRMQALTTDKQVIVGALRESDVLVVDEEGAMVRRRQPFQPDAVPSADNSTIFVDNLPKDQTLDQLLEFFGTLGKVAILRRRCKDSQFLGAAWVQFETEEEAKQLAERKDLQYNGNTLKVEMKAAYVERLSKRKEATVNQNRVLQVKWNTAMNSRDASSAPALPENWKETLEAAVREAHPFEGVQYLDEVHQAYFQFAEPQAAKKVLEALGNTYAIQEHSLKLATPASANEEQKFLQEYQRRATLDERVSFQPGCLLRFRMAEEGQSLDFERCKELRPVLAKALDRPVGFVEYEKGASQGLVRLEEPLDAETLAKPALDNVTVQEKQVQLSVVEGAEEFAFYREKLIRKEQQESSASAAGGKRPRGGNAGGFKNKRTRAGR